MIQISIKNGRDDLWQWDVNQQLVIRGVGDPLHVHFVQDEGTEPLTVAPVKQADGTITVPVPNILLQNAEPIVCYVFYTGTTEQYTKTFKRFYVRPREKPAEYIYTETQLVTWEGLIEQCEGTLREATNILTIADAAAGNAQEAAETAQEAANAAEGKVIEAEESASNAAKSANKAANTQEAVQAYAEAALTEMGRLLDGVIANAEEAEVAEVNAAAFAERAEAAADAHAGVIALDASGATVTLPDSTEWPLRALTVGITATQSGSGDPAPDNVRPINGWSGAQLFTRGKNLLDGSLRAEVWSGSGVTCQYNAEDDTYTINGTMTDTAGIYPKKHILAVGIGEKTTVSIKYVSGSITVPDGKNAVLYMGQSNDANTQSNFLPCNLLQEDTATTKELTRRYAFRTWFYASAGVVFDNYKVRVQIEVGDTATEYEPFKGATASVDFGREVYGGRYDWRAGELTVTHKKATFAGLTWHDVNLTPSEGRNWVSVYAMRNTDHIDWKGGTSILSNVAKTMAWDSLVHSAYTELDAPIIWDAPSAWGYALPLDLLGLDTSATNDEIIAAATAYLTDLGAYEVIEVATPEVVQLGPSALPSTLYPLTTVFTDTGDVTLTYAADTKNYIDRRILELIGG